MYYEFLMPNNRDNDMEHFQSPRSPDSPDTGYTCNQVTLNVLKDNSRREIAEILTDGEKQVPCANRARDDHLN